MKHSSKHRHPFVEPERRPRPTASRDTVLDTDIDIDIDIDISTSYLVYRKVKSVPVSSSCKLVALASLLLSRFARALACFSSTDDTST